jgi:hypothetical protein
MLRRWGTLVRSLSTMSMPVSEASTALSTPGYNTPTPAEGDAFETITAGAAAAQSGIDPVDPSLRQSVIDKWLNPNGPPTGSTFGARKLQEDDDVFSKNAWWVWVSRVASGPPESMSSY